MGKGASQKAALSTRIRRERRDMKTIKSTIPSERPQLKRGEMDMKFAHNRSRGRTVAAEVGTTSLVAVLVAEAAHLTAVPWN